MPRKKNCHKRHPDDAGTYRPRLNAEEKAANHRKASAAHYKRNITEIREKNRIQVAARRAAAKLRKRRWDPPRPSKDAEDVVVSDGDEDSLVAPPLESTGSQLFLAGSSSGGVPSSIPFAILDREENYSEGSSMDAVAEFLAQGNSEPEPAGSDPPALELRAVNASSYSPTPDERIAMEALASMALMKEFQPPLPHDGSDSILSLAGMLSSLDNSASSKVEQQALRVEDTGRQAVTALNAGRSAHPPTALEVQHWLESGRDRAEPGAWMSERNAAHVELWSNVVDRASRRTGREHPSRRNHNWILSTMSSGSMIIITRVATIILGNGERGLPLQSVFGKQLRIKALGTRTNEEVKLKIKITVFWRGPRPYICFPRGEQAHAEHYKKRSDHGMEKDGDSNS
ncbi:hypothetical protein C8J57DRAFT_1231963 [Mycena rebaudengoi]|nr:hypothetical protein C8J57DRAFT_1231963 [Mycena rebaudengoi]